MGHHFLWYYMQNSVIYYTFYNDLKKLYIGQSFHTHTPNHEYSLPLFRFDAGSFNRNNLLQKHRVDSNSHFYTQLMLYVFDCHRSTSNIGTVSASARSFASVVTYSTTILI